MKIFILIIGLWILWMLIGVDGATIKSFIKMTVYGVLLVLFLIPTLKGLFSAVKED